MLEGEVDEAWDEVDEAISAIVTDNKRANIRDRVRVDEAVYAINTAMIKWCQPSGQETRPPETRRRDDRGHYTGFRGQKPMGASILELPSLLLCNSKQGGRPGGDF